MQKTVFLVDDHPFIRNGISMVIQEEDDYIVIGESSTVRDAKFHIPLLKPQYAIVDMSLEDGTGVEILDHIQSHCPETQSIVITMYEEPAYIDRALQAGARGYIFKRESVNTVIEALHTVESGGIFLSPYVIEVLGDDLYRQRLDDPQDVLSIREYEIFKFLSEGLQRKQIAEKLFISTKTYDSHIERIKAKLEIKTIAQLIRYSLQYFLTRP